MLAADHEVFCLQQTLDLAHFIPMCVHFLNSCRGAEAASQVPDFTFCLLHLADHVARSVIVAHASKLVRHLLVALRESKSPSVLAADRHNTLITRLTESAFPSILI